MNYQITKSLNRRGVTLIELTIVIGVVLLLASATFFGAKAYQDWTTGLNAGEDLKKVYSAQKLYLAENPTLPVAGIQEVDIIRYLPDSSTAIPVVTGLEGEALSINFTVTPPVYENGGATYDPSDSTTDNLWDTGR